MPAFIMGQEHLTGLAIISISAEPGQKGSHGDNFATRSTDAEEQSKYLVLLIRRQV